MRDESRRLHGVFPPTMVPVDESGQINEAELRRYTNWLIERGVHGLFPNGSTSEFTRFTNTERRRIVEAMADETRGRVPILAGAAGDNVYETISNCEYYQGLNVRMVVIVAPYYFRVGPESVYAYFKEISDNSPVDLMLYNIPAFASAIDVRTVRRLADECERIVAIKDSSGNLPGMMRMIEAIRPVRPDFTFLTGTDSVLMPMMLIGCDGGIHASSGVVPELMRALYERTVEGELDEARTLQFTVRRLYEAMSAAVEFPEGYRVGVQVRGFEMGPGRQPLTAEQRAGLEKFRDRLREMIAEAGCS